MHGKKVNRNVISCINAVSSSNFRGDLEILASNLKGESGKNSNEKDGLNWKILIKYLKKFKDFQKIFEDLYTTLQKLLKDLNCFFIAIKELKNFLVKHFKDSQSSKVK